MNSHQALVDFLISSGAIHSKNIIHAFKKIDRKDFALPGPAEEIYSDHPLSIGYNQTISQPSTVAFMMELLAPKKGEHILDIGSGSGWTTALLGTMVGVRGTVDGCEIIPELVIFGKENISKYHLPHVHISPSQKDFSCIHGIYDKILVSAEADHIPEILIKSLAVGGSMVIPVHEFIYKIVKRNKKGDLNIFPYYGFVFVPLVTQEE